MTPQHQPLSTQPLSPTIDDGLRDAGRRLVAVALAEDLGWDPNDDQGSAQRGSAVLADVTTAATVAADANGRANLVAREDGVVAGLWLVADVYGRLDDRVQVHLVANDGDAVTAGATLATIEGPLASVLTGERVALNLVGHLSGVATATRAYAEAVASTPCTLRDTRKTTPGMRLLEKAAVRAGGGVNHRIGLYDAILVKDNHVAAVGSVTAATRQALAYAADHGNVVVQIEVDTLDQLDEALAAGAPQVLLDNFTPQLAAEAVARVRAVTDRRVVVEASGGINLNTVAAYAQAGVDHVSVGAVTHSAAQFDVALDVESQPGGDV